MNKTIIGIVVIIILAAAGFGGWYFFIKKSAEGGRCTSDARCQENLKCLNQKCSSGQKGSSCGQKSDCKTGYCVNNTCTEGKKDDACKTYNDCQKDLLCMKSICSTPPDYSKYFGKIVVSKMKPGMPPGPNNVPEPTTEFQTSNAIEVDLVNVKPTAIGEYYFELIDPITGEVVASQEKQKVEGQDRGSGASLSNVPPGDYDLNVYFNDELVYSTQIKVTK